MQKHRSKRGKIAIDSIILYQLSRSVRSQLHWNKLYIRVYGTMVPEALFYSFLANFATRTASFGYFFIAKKRWEARKESFFSRLGASISASHRISKWKKIIFKESLWDQGKFTVVFWISLAGELGLPCSDRTKKREPSYWKVFDAYTCADRY